MNYMTTIAILVWNSRESNAGP